ncbi:MAG: QueT transporter family protein [Chloroflexota bacterium]|nr:QueT transporter family protein [Chloroflexota bacterium]
MRELLSMWKHTQMVVLTVVIAALYAAMLIPFKPISIVPGITELRIAQVVPPVASLLFGPAAAWGAALGNLIGDFFGTLTAGSLFGVIGNFVLGAIPYVLWGRLGPLSARQEPSMRSGKQVGEFVAIVVISGLACAAVIAWGLELLGLFPFAVLGLVISINNVVIPAILGPVLLRLLYRRVQRMGLIWVDVMPEQDIATRGPAGIGAILIVVGGIGGWIAGMLISLGTGAAIGTAGFARAGEGGEGAVIGVVAIFLLALPAALLTARCRPELFTTP